MELEAGVHWSGSSRAQLEELELDSVTLRTFTVKPDFVLADPIAGEMISAAQRRGLPIHYNRYVSGDGREFCAELEQLAGTGLFESVILYEANSLFRSNGRDDVTELLPGLCDEIARTARRVCDI